MPSAAGSGTPDVLPTRVRNTRPARRWALLYLALAVTPLILSLRVGRMTRESFAGEVSLSTGLVAASLLICAYALPSRLRSLSTHLGIENLLRSHRAIALTASVLVLLHIALVLAADPAGWAVLDLRTAPPRVWAGSSATLALLALVVLAVSRRRRRPRYEGWRLVHIALATVVVLGTALHVWWLHHLVTDPVMAVWFGALALLLLAVLAYRWAWRPLRSFRRAYLIESVQRTSPTTVNVVLHARGHRGIAFEAGQFAWLKFGGSPFVFEEHPFTIASTATEPWRKEFTIKALGDFTELMSAMRPGRRVYLDGPHGRFTLAHAGGGAGFVFLAGGVGVTPMLSMLRTMSASSDPRPALLVVGGRTVDELLYRGELAELTSRMTLTVVEVLADPPPGWTGETGFVSAELLDRLVPSPRQRRRRHWFVCGSPPMVTAVLRGLDALGVPRSVVHTELFDM